MVTITLTPETLVRVQAGLPDENPTISTATLAEIEAAFAGQDEEITDLKAALGSGKSYYLADMVPYTYTLAVVTDAVLAAYTTHDCAAEGHTEETCDLACPSCGTNHGFDGYCVDSDCPNYKGALAAEYLERAAQ